VATGGNVGWRGVEESQRGEGSELVCLEAEGEAPFYRIARWPRRMEGVDHGDDV
jgi:hypothetical protein